MESQGDRLARLLVKPNWDKAMEKEGRCHFRDRLPVQSDGFAHVHGNWTIKGHVAESRTCVTTMKTFDRRSINHKQNTAFAISSGPGYGLPSERDVQAAPFEKFVVELIGPWSVKVNVRLVEYKVLTIIDTVTNLVELIRTDCKEVTQVRANFV